MRRHRAAWTLAAATAWSVAGHGGHEQALVNWDTDWKAVGVEVEVQGEMCRAEPADPEPVDAKLTRAGLKRRMFEEPLRLKLYAQVRCSADVQAAGRHVWSGEVWWGMEQPEAHPARIRMVGPGEHKAHGTCRNGEPCAQAWLRDAMDRALAEYQRQTSRYHEEEVEHVRELQRTLEGVSRRMGGDGWAVDEADLERILGPREPQE